MDQFTREKNTGSDGGVGQDNIDELDACQDACRDDSECLGFDWTLDDGADTRCWLHSDEDKFDDDRKDNDDSDQYTRVDCKCEFSRYVV